jgi:hypothetical protein
MITQLSRNYFTAELRYNGRVDNGWIYSTPIYLGAYNASKHEASVAF